MSGVNSKCSRGDLTPPRPKRLKQEDSTLVRIASTEQIKPPTSPETPVNRVSNFPFELLPEVVGYFAAECNPEELLDLRLVSKMFNREVYSALKANPALLPWIVLNDNSMDQVKTALSRNKSGNYSVVKSLESYRRNFAPGCGLPIKLVANQWTPELASFLRDYSKEIVGFWICGKDLVGFPEDLGGIELPALEHAPFSAICGCYNKTGFVKALAFWKKLVEASKTLKTCQLDIRIQGPHLTPDDHVFDLVEWSRVNSLKCSYEFFAKATASIELLGLQKFQCESTFDLGRRERPISLEKVANLAEMKIGRKIEWILNHEMTNLKVLALEDTTITCGQSPSIFLPNLEKIAVRDYKFDFTDRSTFSSLIRGGGVYENVAELELMEYWNRLDLPIRNLAVQICDCFPKLTKLEWESNGCLISPPWAHPIVHNNYAFRAAPVIFSKLDLLTRLKLRVLFVSRERGTREVVELVTGIRLEEIPVKKDSWPTALTGNPRSITNLKHLQSFDLQLASGQVNVFKRHSNFLFTAAFRTMATLNDLSFQGIIFKDTSCATEWQQLGRTIKMTGTNASSNGGEDSSESSSESDQVDDESSGDEWTMPDSHSESSDDD